MAFDECTPYPCDYRYAQRSMNTPLVRPMCESFRKVPVKYGYDKLSLLQGSCYKDLRQQSAEYIANRTK
jgi:queuine tRNA-ribosyltransferase